MRHDGDRHINPLSESELLILLSLADEPRHGFAMLKDIEALSAGRVRMSTGTLYGALRRLLEDGWIERHREADAPRGRQAYKLSATGQEILRAEIGRMKSLARIATARLSRGEA